MAADMIGGAAARPSSLARRALSGGQRLAGRRHHARRAWEAQAGVSAGATACPRRPPPHSRAVDAGRSAPPAVRAASRTPGCGPGLPRTTALRCTARPGTSAPGPGPGPSQSARSLPPARTAATRPPRAHGRGLPGPLPPRARTRPSGAGSLRVAVGPRRRCPRRPAAAANGSRRPRALPGRGGRAGGCPDGCAGGGSERGSARGGAAPQERSAALLTNGSSALQLTKKPVDQWKPGAGTKSTRA